MVVKTRLSVGILGAVREKMDASEANILEFTQKNLTETFRMLLLPLKEIKNVTFLRDFFLVYQ